MYNSLENKNKSGEAFYIFTEFFVKNRIKTSSVFWKNSYKNFELKKITVMRITVKFWKFSSNFFKFFLCLICVFPGLHSMQFAKHCGFKIWREKFSGNFFCRQKRSFWANLSTENRFFCLTNSFYYFYVWHVWTRQLKFYAVSWNSMANNFFL